MFVRLRQMLADEGGLGLGGRGARRGRGHGHGHGTRITATDHGTRITATDHGTRITATDHGRRPTVTDHGSRSTARDHDHDHDHERDAEHDHEHDRAHSPPRSPRSHLLAALHHGRRGVALVMVLAMVVFLTAFIVEFSYTSRVDYLQGAHYRDKVRAHYLAQSGVRIYVLFMAYAQQMASNPLVQQYLPMLGGSGAADKIWQQLPWIDTAFLRAGMAGVGGFSGDGLLDGLLGGQTDDPDALALGQLQNEHVQFEFDEATQARIDAAIERDETALTRPFLAFDGDFRAEINDEDGKINLNSLASSSVQDIRMDPIALAMHGLMEHERYDEMFDERNEFDRWELIANIKDFVDPDDQASTLVGGFEDGLYDDVDKWGRNFEPKNLPFDSLDEVQLVAGVNDEIYLTFGPQWTIYGNNKINITTCSDAVLYALIRAFADYTVNDQLIRETVGELQVMRMLNMLTTETFIATITSKGITLTDQAGLQNLIKTNSRHFTIVSTGYVGDVEATIEVVMNFQGSRFKTLSWREY